MRIKHILAALALLAAACTPRPQNVSEVDAKAPVFPNYDSATVPVNIAPMNIMANEESAIVDVSILDTEGNELLHSGGRRSTSFDEDDWHALLAAHQDQSLSLSVCVKNDQGWQRYRSIHITVSPDTIDHALVYRLIAPGYETYSQMGIYEHNLTNNVERPIVKNTLANGNCLNCHSFNNRRTNQMNLHVRGTHGCTVILDNGQMQLYNTKTDSTQGFCVYPYWHPSGRYIAYSVNNTQQVFHSFDARRVEVIDHWSDVVVLDLQTHTLISTPQLKSPDRFETFPTFSPDGRSLYFCTAQAVNIKRQTNDVRYSLCRITFDPENGRFGEQVDTLVNCEGAERGSISFPRVSPDGRFLAYTRSDYGQFSIWHSEADIWLYDLERDSTFVLAPLNSPDVESYHSWSSTGRWIVVSSRRTNGLFTQPFIAHIDADGHASTPFLLPQSDPAIYDERFYSYNIPEFVVEPVDFNRNTFETKLNAQQLENFSFEMR